MPSRPFHRLGQRARPAGWATRHGVASRPCTSSSWDAAASGRPSPAPWAEAATTSPIIDADASAFRRLGTSFEGQTVTGIGFDRDTLVAAGIREAYAFAAVSSGDNSNILAARVARETFGVEHVAARIYDPQRAMVYQRLGIPTVATVRWTSDQMIQRLLPQGAVPELTDPSGKIVIAEVPLAEAWVGRHLTDVEEQTGARVAYVTRLGEGTLPRPDMVVQQGDLVHLTVPRDDLARVERLCDQAPAAH